MIKEVL